MSLSTFRVLLVFSPRRIWHCLSQHLVLFEMLGTDSGPWLWNFHQCLLCKPQDSFECAPVTPSYGHLTSQPGLLGCAQNIDGDGRWKIEWYGVPCNVGDGKLQYSFVMKDYYFFEFVVSNTRIPINGVSVYINGKWLDLARTHTNTWAYYRVRGFLSLFI